VEKEAFTIKGKRRLLRGCDNCKPSSKQKRGRSLCSIKESTNRTTGAERSNLESFPGKEKKLGKKSGKGEKFAATR